MLLYWVVERELAALFQEQDRSGGELLGYGADAEFGGGIVGDAPFQIGETVAFTEQDLAATGDEHRPHEVMIGGVGLEEMVEVLAQNGEGEQEQNKPMHDESIASDGQGGSCYRCGELAPVPRR